jgi:hypothetical protein
MSDVGEKGNGRQERERIPTEELLCKCPPVEVQFSIII